MHSSRYFSIKAIVESSIYKCQSSWMSATFYDGDCPKRAQFKFLFSKMSALICLTRKITGNAK